MDTTIIIIIIVLIILFYLFLKSDTFNKDIKTNIKNKYDKYIVPSNKLYEQLPAESFNETAKITFDKANDDYEGHFIKAEILRNNIKPLFTNIEEQNEIDRLADEEYNLTLQRVLDESLLNNPEPTNKRKKKRKNKNKNHRIPLNFVFDRIETEFLNEPIAPIYREINRENTENLIEYKPTVVNDPQNVHDVTVNQSIKDIYNRIISLNRNNGKNLNEKDFRNEMLNEIYKINNDVKRKNAIEAFNIIMNGGPLSNLNTTEDNVLKNIWLRINSDDNEANKSELKSSVTDALASCVENGHLVCANGRCARVFGALTLLDNDNSISKPLKTKDILRNEIFMKSNQILKTELAKLSKLAIDDYNNANETPEIINFDNHVKLEINKQIKKEYKDVDEKTLNEIIKDAEAGI